MFKNKVFKGNKDINIEDETPSKILTIYSHSTPSKIESKIENESKQIVRTK